MIFQDPLTSLNPLYRIGDQLTETILTHENMSAKAAADKAERLLVEVAVLAQPGDHSARRRGHDHQRRAVDLTLHATNQCARH